MRFKPVTLLYIITVAVIVAALVWEYYMQQWMATQPDGGSAVMRVDLFVIWPLVITLVSICIFRLVKGRK
ncbi:MAG TPA: hypothetical protein EYN07_11760 [Flavobacteriaceae bacterium]|jgi:hypothetical protein|nr:hypothetical protein [Flavobacteriaceae bacterium]HIB49463.1 hypothetical protein [Flavobacteriaceae bacterium]HIN99899.1 hypothetical protein [Flavobacteriaceae bacterium]|tara:strand:- start:6204 stop:6413 length:210 start_codon:yes stop_codon:yes gene_type:complete